jgi:hypothetical protein
MKSLFYFVFIIFGIWGCSKDKKSADLLYLKIDPEALKYLQFDPGKYFIYKDSASGRLDSVLLLNNTFATKYVGAVAGTWGSTPAYTTESITVILHRYGDNVSTQWLHANGQPDFYSSYIIFNSNDHAPVTLTETINRPQGGISSIHGVFSSLSTPFSMTAEGINYPSVILGGFKDASYYANSLREFYWAKNVGIIKRVLVLENVRYVSTLVRHGKN